MARKQSTGLRSRVARTFSELDGGNRGRASRKNKNLAQRATSDLASAAEDIRKRLTGGETKRGLTGRKSAATRKRNATRRSAAAKRGAQTRAAKR
jgi:hypothetical protein